MAPDVVRNPNANVGYHPENGQEQPYGNIVNNQNVDVSDFFVILY